MIQLRLLAGLAVVVFAGGCGSQSSNTPAPIGPVPSTATVDAASGDVLIGERRDARTRAAAHTELAGAYFERGDMAVALDEVRVALQADSDYGPAHNLMGLIQMDLKQNAAAQSSFERALRIDPRDSDANHNMGRFLCQTGRAEDGIKYFMVAVQNPLYRTLAKTYTAAGACYERSGSPAEALEMYERALRNDGKYSPAMLPYARLQMARGGLNEARSAVQQFNTVNQPTPESLWLQLRIEHRRGDSQSEEAAGAQLKRRFPDSREYRQYQRGEFE